MPPETRYAKSGGLNIAYQVVGDGPVDLVYVPGWVSHVELAWELPDLAHGFERLASFSRLILFDKRGTGMSDPVPESGLPTLVMHRIDDRDAHREEAHYIAARIPHARVVEFEGSDHSWWTQDQDAILDEIQQHVTGVRPAPKSRAESSIRIREGWIWRFARKLCDWLRKGSSQQLVTPTLFTTSIEL